MTPEQRSRTYRSAGGIWRTLSMNWGNVARSHFKCTRAVDAGRVASDTPGLRSVRGRIGRGTKPPPQLGQTLPSTDSTQLAQKVHSKLQMRASVACEGRSLSQYSQLGLS